MATITRRGDFMDHSGTFRRFVGEYSGPASYATGGDAFTPQQCALGAITEILIGLAWSGSAIRLVVWDRTNQKMVWYIPNTGAEVTAATDLTTFTAPFEAIGH